MHGITSGALELYLLGINVLGFLLYSLNIFLCRRTSIRQISAVLMIASVLGGSLGILLCIVLFDRKSVKENMMSRVVFACLLVIQILAYLLWTGKHGQEISFNLIRYFAEHRLLLYYCILINAVTFVVYAIDKWKAKRNVRRIRILTLLGLAFIGGTLGGLASMYTFRHKTSRNYFFVGLPLMLVMQLVILFFAMNFKGF